MEPSPALLAVHGGKAAPGWCVLDGMHLPVRAKRCLGAPGRGGHLPLVRTLGWPQPKAKEGEVTPNVLQTPGNQT